MAKVGTKRGLINVAHVPQLAIATKEPPPKPKPLPKASSEPIIKVPIIQWKVDLPVVDHFFIRYFYKTFPINPHDHNREIANRYEVLNKSGDIIFYAIEYGNRIARFMFGSAAPYHIILYDTQGEYFLNIKHSWSNWLFCFGGYYGGNKITVEIVDGNSVCEIGNLNQRFSTKISSIHEIQYVRSNLNKIEPPDITGNTKSELTETAQLEQEIKIQNPPPPNIDSPPSLPTAPSSPSTSQTPLIKLVNSTITGFRYFRIINWLWGQFTLLFLYPQFQLSNESEESIGHISNGWNMNEDIENSDITKWNYNSPVISGISFPQSLDDNFKLLLLGSIFAFHFQYFDGKHLKITLIQILFYILLITLIMYGLSHFKSHSYIPFVESNNTLPDYPSPTITDTGEDIKRKTRSTTEFFNHDDLYED